MWQNQGTGYYNSLKNSKRVGMLFSGIFCYKAIVMFTQVCMHKITKQIFKGHIAGIIRVLARELKLLTFSWKWEIRLAFTKVCHHDWQQEKSFGTTHRMLENTILRKKYFRSQHTQITAEKCFFLCLS